MSLIIYLISFLEGFTTLSIEIIALRNFTPIIGTNSISTSIILGVILLALSYGYYSGGKKTKGKTTHNLINIVILNLCISSLYYLLFTFTFDIFILSFLLDITSNYFISILLSSIILFFIPIFFASQTIPLLSEVLKGNNVGEKIGKLLFYSTVGSFLGSILTSSLLFPILGVEKTAIFNSLILSLLIIILWLTKKSNKIDKFLIIGVLIFSYSIVQIITKENIIENIVYEKSNSYHNISIYETDYNHRFFSLNGGYSSGIDISTKESFFKYIIEIKEQILKNQDTNILVIGAAGFTLPSELSKYGHIENIDVVDVDGTLKEISEKYFLKEKLSDKINFFAEPSRYFINNSIKDGKKYDSIVIDVYVGKSLPAQTLTYEFFNDVKSIGNNIYINLISDKRLETVFSKKVMNTINEAFPLVYYRDVNRNIESSSTNFVITNKEISGYTKYEPDDEYEYYTDNKNSIEIDLFKFKNKKD